MDKKPNLHSYNNEMSSANSDSLPNPSSSIEAFSPAKIIALRFKKDRLAMIGLLGACATLLIACSAPLLANSRPILAYFDGIISFPALRYFFSPDSTESAVEKIFNFLLLYIPSAIVLYCLIANKNLLRVILPLVALILLIPFLTAKSRLDKTDWKERARNFKAGEFAIFAPIKYGPYERANEPFSPPSLKHPFGTDQNGRDVLARMIYGARVSLAVGILATGMTMLIGIIVGMISGYFGKTLDAVLMRIVEIVMCFPTFLLLLILMVIMMDKNIKQSILLVIAVIGLTSWTGLSRIVRGEVLKERAMAYIRSCECLGLPVWRIMAFHLFPNVLGPILVSFTFGVAGAVLAESGLSFLGFGVQPPTASWGELLREAMSNPLQHWHLTLWPGAAIFITVISFNFIGEGLKKAYHPE